MTRRESRGQASVELALALPLLCIWLLAIAQLVLVVRDQLAVVHAAREGARAAAVSTAPAGSASRAATAAVSQTPLRISTSAGAAVRVTVRYASQTDVPIVGALIPDIDVSATATMSWEP